MGNRSILSKSCVKADIKKKAASGLWHIFFSVLLLLLCINKIYRPQKLRLANAKQKYIEQTKTYEDACLTTIISRVQRQLYFPLFSIIKEPLY